MPDEETSSAQLPREAAPAAGEDVLTSVRAHLDAFNRRDVEAVIAGFADDAVFAAGDDLVIGHTALRAFFADAFDALPDATLELRAVVASGATAACEVRETITVQGAVMTLDFAAFYTVRRGRLARVRVYRDHAG